MSFTVDFSKKSYRSFAIVTDKYGIDPLLDKVVPKVLEIETFYNYTVTQAERGAPDLISFNVYGTEDYYWHIMAYNGIYRYSEFVEGRVLKIPDLASLIEITNSIDTTSSQSTAKRLTTI